MILFKRRYTSIKALKKKKVEFILKSPEYQFFVDQLANKIAQKSNDISLSEASIASIFELNLFKFIVEMFDQEIFPQKEVAIETERRIAKGRIDSKIGAVVIEFKKPAVLRHEAKQKEATEQLEGYLKSLLKEQGGIFVGIVTDGVICQVIRYSENNISIPAYRNICGTDIDTIIKSILLLDETALSPENLIKDFCHPLNDNLVTSLTRTLYQALSNKITPKTEMLFTEWQEIFRLAHDDISKQTAIIERKKALEDVIGHSLEDNISEYRALYALQTTYAIIIKIIAYKVISKKIFHRDLTPCASFLTKNPFKL